MFKPVSSKLNIPLLEEDILRFWTLHRIFERSEEQRRGAPEFVFYEGPPTANGLPGVHHALARAFKDIFPRYKVMRGYHVSRRGGWDTHGLPVEIGVEKQLGFTSKSQIEAYGIERFNELCRKSAFEYIQEWQRFTDRLGFWVDMADAYVTFTNDYIESIWWILKALWDKGLLYQGYKVVPYCPRCGTPLSDHEVALGYRQTADPSVFVRLPLVDEPGASLLVWTTTPWTLPGNVAVAVHPEVEYVTVERPLPEGGRERLILARSLLEKVFGDAYVRVIDAFLGKKLKGRHYQPLFTFLIPDRPAHYVILQDYVTVEDGTGLVHIAPAFGAEDLQAALEYDLPVLMTVAEDGTFIAEVRPWSGRFVKDADPFIIQDLERRGLLFSSGSYTHTYPFCWRCDTPLLYTARSTWYIRTSQYKERMLALNQEINWVPGHIKHGRFGDWLENNVDWALGRERYWGTPLPVWECQGCHHQECLGSVEELSRLAGRDLSELDLHRPAIDQVQVPCPKCGGTMQRVPELIDVWFDSGSMPVAQWHFPFENREAFRKQYPADFICEAVDQTRGWFYALHAISAMLMDSVAFKNVICLGLVLNPEGQKMSKSRGTAIDAWEVFNTHGADAFRWYLYTSAPSAQERSFSLEQVGEVVRGLTLTLWNVYAFFVTNANLDGWLPTQAGNPAQAAHTPLDRWLLSELHSLAGQVSQALENYDVPGATRPIQAFVQDLSRWYLRRSRRRFWKNAATADKNAAYAALYTTLVTLSKLLAPFMPFLAEALYQNLVRAVDLAAPLSVHLVDWPRGEAEQIDEALCEEMRLVMKLASLGHAARSQTGLKVRQPLLEAAFALARPQEQQTLLAHADLLADELNVKQVRLLQAAGEAISYSLNPLPRQLGQKYQARFPALRQAILELDAVEAAQTLAAGQPLKVLLGGEAYEIQPDEVEVRSQARSGLTVAAEGAYLAALRTELTPELKREGLAREFVRQVQELRKQAELELTARIRLYVETTPKLAQAIAAHREYVMNETLAIALENSAPPAEAAAAQAWFDGEWIKLGIVAE
ncbi:MAG: isoleucine--tRNA ligase [Anaerolineales bacterium]|nr:isoleucine--tRNA ligase [Anaerolineales bacterium]